MTLGGSLGPKVSIGHGYGLISFEDDVSPGSTSP